MCSEIDRYQEVFKLNDSKDDLIRLVAGGRTSTGAIRVRKDRGGYRETTLDGVKKRVHRIIFALHNGYLPLIVDHIDGDITNNHVSNLRAADHAINAQNSRRRKARDLPMGVQRGHKSPNYTAWITIKGQNTYLGTYPTPESAHKVYLQAKRQHHLGYTV